jgi:hypothetical protein
MKPPIDILSWGPFLDGLPFVNPSQWTAAFGTIIVVPPFAFHVG